MTDADWELYRSAYTLACVRAPPGLIGEALRSRAAHHACKAVLETYTVFWERGSAFTREGYAATVAPAEE